MSERRLAAIMFTDIVGYTALMGKDEDQAFQTLRKNRNIHKPLIKKYNGKWLKEMGDGILASFHTASDAVRCAREIQQISKKEGIGLRIGIHEGEVVFEGGDVLGDGVNVASRLENFAEEGCIYISESVYKDIRNKSGISAEFIEEKKFKNVEEPIKVYRVSYEESIEDLYHETEILKRKIKSKSSFYIISVSIVLLIAIILLWQFLPTKEKVELEKSIAVLPLKYLSEDQDKQYLADGVMDAITGHLSKIEGLRVTPRTSVEQYRETTKTASVIGKELDVSYLIEGSFLMVSDQVVLTIQLVIAEEEDHIFFKEYNRDYKDIITVQSEIAQTIANEIKVIITPKEKELIEKIPTENLTAYDLYLKARSETDIEKAIMLYNLVIDFDSTFSLAYAGLAQYYIQKHFWNTYFKEDFLDSAQILANIALSYDDQLDEAYLVKGEYFQSKGQLDKAQQNFEKVIEINPNSAKGWYNLSGLYARKGDYLNAIICIKKTDDIDFNEYHYRFVYQMALGLSNLGLFEESRNYYKELLTMEAESMENFDSLKYKITMLLVEYYYAFNDSLLSLLELAVIKNPDNQHYLHHLGYQYMFHGDYKEAYFYIKKHKDLMEKNGAFELVRTHRLGYVAWQLGKYEEAEDYFKTQMYNCQESIRLKRHYGLKDAYYDLAGIYAFKGEKDLAYENLDKFASDNFYAIWFINLINNDPMFNTIREEPRFQQIVRNMEAKNRKERERCRAWAVEHNMF